MVSISIGVKFSGMTYCLSRNPERSCGGCNMDNTEHHVCEVVRYSSRNHQEKDTGGNNTLLRGADRKRRGRPSVEISAYGRFKFMDGRSLTFPRHTVEQVSPKSKLFQKDEGR